MAVTGSNARARGVLLCLSSAVGFALMAILAKGAFAAGVSVMTLLALRFSLAAGALWAIVARVRPARPDRGDAVRGLGLGAVCYAAESALFFVALTRIDASMASLVMYAYPALVVAGAIALGRERLERRKLAALALATGGAALVAAGGGAGGAVDPLGVALALAAAAGYATYILAADRVAERVEPLMMSALVTTGAGAVFWLAGLVSGSLDLGFGAGGWLALIALAGVSTVLPIAAFLASLPLIGPSTASVLSTVEPVITVALAVVVLGEHLSPVQALGGMLVLSAVFALQVRPSNVRGHDAPARLPAAAPAREVAELAA
jgi:drug/metabolite transporter (DMT)-like permease